MRMGRRRALLGVAVLVVLTGGCEGDSSSPEAFGKTVFTALQHGSFEEMAGLVAQKADLMDFVRVEHADAKRREDELARLESKPAAYWSERRERQEKKFRETLAAAKEVGVEWKDATYVKTVVEDNPAEGFVAGDFFVIIERDGHQYYAKADNCRKAKRGWVIDGGLEWRGRWNP
jgi:hypothetical protein